MAKFKKGDVLYEYDSFSNSISELKISRINSDDIFFNGCTTVCYQHSYVNSLLESDDIGEAMRQDKLSLINLVYKTKFNAMEEEIESFEASIFSLREDIQSLVRWRKKEIGTIPSAPKKAITINCSLPTFIIT